MKVEKFCPLRYGIAILSIYFLCLGGILTAQQTDESKKVLAPTPPMGWNSWDSYGLRIDEQQFRDNVDALHAKLQPSGYKYAVIDEGWYMANPQDRPKPELLQYAVDKNGRFIPVTDRFPSAMQNGSNTGFEQLASWIHSQGLKFGIHIIRGIPRESVSRNLPIEGTNFKAQDAADQGDPCPWTPPAGASKTMRQVRRGTILCCVSMLHGALIF